MVQTSENLTRVRHRLRGTLRALRAQRVALAERDRVAGELQAAILGTPGPATDLNDVRVAVRHLGADGCAQVGGDWHLFAPLPGGDVLLGVGDVAGHGLAVTGVMAQLRPAATALAVAGYGPGDILRVLNTLLLEYMTGATATAVVARYQRSAHELTWASAGHLPILRAGANGVTPLRQPPGAMLGALPQARYGDAATVLGAADLLLMYTDGFVESRGSSVDDGLRAVGDELGRTLAAAPGDRAGTVVARLHRRNPDDDACVLAAEMLR